MELPGHTAIALAEHRKDGRRVSLTVMFGPLSVAEHSRGTFKKMTDAASYGRLIGAQINAMRHSLGALVGIAQGLLCDGVLTDDEVRFLKKWFTENEELCYAFPGDVVYNKVKEILSDGVVTEAEREHLIKVLRDLIGAPETDLAAAARVIEPAYDQLDRIDFAEKYFLLTGEFIHGPRKHCETVIKERGGLISKSVNKRLNYLIIGSLGSVEWKHGSFGTKIEKVMQYKREQVPIYVVKEAVWREALKHL
jgi:hypothetical protein